MATHDLGRVMGSRWYSGTGITGTSGTPTIFSGSGVTYAYTEDMYLNTSNGNVYNCTVAGDADTAKWVYNCNIAGPVAELVDNLTTDSGTKALTARQGKVLNEKILACGVYPTSIEINEDTTCYIAEVTVRNIDGTLSFSDGTTTATYAYTKSGTSEQATVTVDIGTDIGFSQEGAVLTNISFTDNIYAIVLKDTNADTFYNETYNAWEYIDEANKNVSVNGTVTDGTETLRVGLLSKIINGVRTTLYPKTHAKAVYYDKTNNVTVHDKLANVGHTATVVTLSSSGWNSSNVYSLTSSYPDASYDIQVAPYSGMTTAQLKAWSLAKPVGSSTSNTITALGEKPTIDIPVLVYAFKKG